MQCAAEFKPAIFSVAQMALKACGEYPDDTSSNPAKVSIFPLNLKVVKKVTYNCMVYMHGDNV